MQYSIVIQHLVELGREIFKNLHTWTYIVKNRINAINSVFKREKKIKAEKRAVFKLDCKRSESKGKVCRRLIP